MLLHIIPKSTFTLGQIEFLDEVFGRDSADHWLYGPPWHGYEEINFANNVHEERSLWGLFGNPLFKKRLKSCSFILLDYASLSALYGLAPYLKRTVVQFWGGDLHSIIHPERALKVARSRAALFALKRCAGYLTLTKMEYQKLAATADLKGFHLLGGVGAPKRVLKETYLQIPHMQRGSRVLLGNSATESGRHKDAIDRLSKFKSCGIELYVPLSYGNSDYAKEITEYGCRIFGQNFHPVTEYMDKHEYAHFLSTMDVAVFNYERQQGLGNLFQLFLSGAKVYLAREGDLFDHFSQLGFKVFSFESISSLDCSSFLHYDARDRDRNSLLASPEETWGRWMSNWSEIRNYLLEYERSS